MSDTVDYGATGWPPVAPLPPRQLSLRGLANSLSLLLVVLTAAIVCEVGLHQPAGRSIRPSWSESSPVFWLDLVSDLAKIATVAITILFLVWFRRARINAEHHGWRQRRARGWTFWGWVVPVANLWIPFQIMGDIWRAGLPEPARSKTAWLPALWWTAWLLGGGTEAISGRSPAAGKVIPGMTPGAPLAGQILLAAAALALLAIIRKVSDGPVGAPDP